MSSDGPKRRDEAGPRGGAASGPNANGKPRCPACGADLGAASGVRIEDDGRLTCPGCGGRFRARRREGRSGEVPAATPAAPPPAPPTPTPSTPAAEPPTTGGAGLVARGLALTGLRWAYRLGTAAGAGVLFALGGFVPVARRWLDDDLDGWGGALEALGGVRVEAESADPDADYGPALARAEAPALFDEVADVARRLGARPPGQLRLAFLPCCGVVAWRRERALLLGLPLLHVLTRAELRAVLAHEMAHLARGDATAAARSAHFVESLGRALDRDDSPSRWSPLRAWASACRRLGDRLIAPIARGQEIRADRAAASLVGGDDTASALVKVALVQPLFREVLDRYDSAPGDLPNLYAFFRAFWSRLPESLHASMRHRLLTDRRAPVDPSHPSLIDRLSVVQSYPPRRAGPDGPSPATTLVGDLEALERMLHDRLFSTGRVEPSVFHRAGS